MDISVTVGIQNAISLDRNPGLSRKPDFNERAFDLLIAISRHFMPLEFAYMAVLIPQVFDRTATKKRRGLTLIELVVVVLILAVLAGLMIPQVSNLWRPAQTASEADTIGQLVNYLTLHETRTQAYPDQFDSLMTDGSTAYSKMAKDLFIGKQKFTLAAVEDTTTEKYFSSLKKAGITKVMRHDETEAVSSNSGKTVYTLATGDLLPTLNPTSTEGTARILSIFPGNAGVVPTGTKLVVLGVGPMNTAVGVSMNSAPISPHPEEYVYYRRYLAVFAIYADGSRGRLKAVLDRHGDTLDDTLRKNQEESRAK